MIKIEGLLPCPFCGCKDIFLSYPPSRDDPWTVTMTLACNGCGIQLPSMLAVQDCEKNIKGVSNDLVLRWNTRHSS